MIALAERIHTRRPAGIERRRWDGLLLGSVFALLLISIVMVYSASVSIAERTQGTGTFYLVRHCIHIIVSVVVMFFAMHTRIRFWQQAGPILLFISIGLLMLVLVPGFGVRINGSLRWISLGFINIQPSEFVKLFIVIYVAGYLVRKQHKLRFFVPGILIVSVIVALIGMLLLRQPDLGTLAVICITVLGMMFLAGIRFWHFVLVVVTGVCSLVVLTLISPYRTDRITGFMDPWADPFNTGFQLVQALIAFGRGECLGVGLGASVQKLFYLPAAHTDFLLAVIAEELGLLGVVTVVVLFAVLTLRAFNIAAQAERAGNLYACRLAQGIGLLLGSQAAINMGVNMGLLPTKGLTLPLVSYGGSSMIVSAVAVGLLLMIKYEVGEKTWERQ